MRDDLHMMRLHQLDLLPAFRVLVSGLAIAESASDRIGHIKKRLRRWACTRVISEHPINGCL